MPNLKHSLHYIVNRYDSDGSESIIQLSSLESVPIQETILRKDSLSSQGQVHSSVDLGNSIPLKKCANKSTTKLYNCENRDSTPFIHGSNHNPSSMGKHKNRTSSEGTTPSGISSFENKSKCPHWMASISNVNMGRHIKAHMRHSLHLRIFCQWCSY